MDLTQINLNDYNLVHPDSIEQIDHSKKFIDITVQDDNSFFVYNEKVISPWLSKNCDGSHITGLYVGFLKKFAASIIKDGKLKKLRTPIVCMKDKTGKIKKLFFTLTEYKKYEEENKDNKQQLIPFYYKGLGSWKAADLRELIKQYGLEHFLEPLTYDENADDYIHKWLDGKEADARKEFLRNYVVDLDKI